MLDAMEKGSQHGLLVKGQKDVFCHTICFTPYASSSHAFSPAPTIYEPQGSGYSLDETLYEPICVR